MTWKMNFNVLMDSPSRTNFIAVDFEGSISHRVNKYSCVEELQRNCFKKKPIKWGSKVKKNKELHLE